MEILFPSDTDNFPNVTFLKRQLPKGQARSWGGSLRQGCDRGRALRLEQTRSRALRLEQTRGREKRLEQTRGRELRLEQTRVQELRLEQTRGRALRLEQTRGRALRLEQTWEVIAFGNYTSVKLPLGKIPLGIATLGKMPNIILSDHFYRVNCPVHRGNL